MSYLTKRTWLLAALATTLLCSIILIVVNNNMHDDIPVVSRDAWIYQYKSAEELLSSPGIHLAVEATVLPNTKPYTIIYEQPSKVVLHNTLTDVRVDRVLKSTQGNVYPRQTIPIIESTSFSEDDEFGTIEVGLEGYRKAKSGLQYLFLLSWNEQEQKYHIMAAHFGKYNLDGKDKRERAFEETDERYAWVKRDMLANARMILAK